MRWAALLWLAVWMPSYVSVWGWVNFLHLCDVAAILTCAGLWRGSALLLSSQAVSSIVVDLVWDLDLAWRLARGEHLIGGTEYMFDARFPAFVRVLSLFHVFWPVLLLWSLRRVGYDRRGLMLQSGIALIGVVAGRLAGPEANVNFAFRDPILHRAWGPAPLHMTLMLCGLVGILYVPTHFVLSRAYRSAGR